MPHSEEFLDITSMAPRPCHLVPNGGTFSVLGHSIINAPPRAVYDAIIDLSSYNNWNSFFKDAVVSKPAAGQSDKSKMMTGAHMKFTVDMGNASPTTSAELVTLVEPLKTLESGGEAGKDGERPTTTIRWCFDNGTLYVPQFVLKSEHMNEVIDIGDGKTELVHWETFGGLAAGFLKSRYGDHLRKVFNNWADELKAYVEGRVQKDGGGA